MNSWKNKRQIVKGGCAAGAIALGSIVFGVVPAQANESEYFKSGWECERAESLLEISDSIVKPCTENRVGWYLIHT